MLHSISPAEARLKTESDERLLVMLRQQEGLRLTPYRDSRGITTIGYGHNLEANPLPWLVPGQSIPSRVAEAILGEDLEEARNTTNVHFPWTEALDIARRDVLVNMVFNMGGAIVATFHDTLQAVQDGRYDDAAWGMLNSAWHRQVGTRAAILADIMRTGVWPA